MHVHCLQVLQVAQVPAGGDATASTPAGPPEEILLTRFKLPIVPEMTKNSEQ